MQTYWPVALMLVVAVGFAAVTMVVSALVSTRTTPNPEKLKPYECGVESEGSNLVQVPVKFYLVCLLFLLFDVETIFIVTWALAFPDLGLYGFLAMAVFLLFLVVGLAYEWKKGALTWQ